MKPLVVFDFETTGLDVWNPDFRVISAAFLTVKDSDSSEMFIQGHEAVGEIIAELCASDAQILVYNASFEWSVCKAVYGLDLGLSRVVDVMRLVQLWGCAFDGQGWGLQAATGRILGIKGYKEKYYDWLRSNIPEAKAKPGRFLSQLPSELLEAYNLDDVRFTLALYQKISRKFGQEGFDFEPDHVLYRQLVQWVSESRIRGISVDRASLDSYIPSIDAEVAEIDAKFHKAVGAQIEAVRADLKAKEQKRFKKKVVTETPSFNIQSKAHLEALFCGKLGLTGRLKTPTGRPSFKASHLGQWGSAGTILEKRGKRLKVKEHATKMLEASEGDGRWHADLKLCGTLTGRLAGGKS